MQNFDHQILHMSEIIWYLYLSLSDWCMSLTKCSPGPPILSQRENFLLFLRLSSIPLCKCPRVVLSTHLLMDTGCFHILGIVNDTVMNIGVLTFFQISVLGSFRYIPRSGIAGPKGRSIFNFSRSQWLHSLHSTNSTQGSSFLHIFASSTYLLIY